MSAINGLLGKLKVKKEANHRSQLLESSINNFEDKLPNTSVSTDYKTKTFSIAQTLQEVLSDSVAISYYINFLESIGCLNLIKFWLHVNGFKASFNNDNIQSAKTDAENIFNTFLNLDSSLSISFLERLRNIILARISQNHISFNCFDDAQNIVFELMANRYFKQFMHSYFYAKYQFEVFQSKKLLLHDILRSHQLLSSFIEYLEQNNQRNLLEFIIAVNSFVAEMEEDNNNKNSNCVFNFQDDAIVIYDRYISMQATDSLGFDDETRIQVEGCICSVDGRPRIDAFERPRLLVLNILQNEVIPLFLKSTFFIKIVLELRNAIENNFDLVTPFTRMNDLSHHLFLSSSSNINSSEICEFNHENLIRNNSLSCDEAFNSNQLINNLTQNDLLKNKKNKLREKCSSLAKIDRFGRYTPLFDNTIINEEEFNLHSTKNRLKNRLDKYLNQTAIKESLVADEMAEHIINDIHKMVALGNNSPRH